MGIKEETAGLQQTCDLIPTCSSGILDEQSCQCREETVQSSFCKSGNLFTDTNGICRCALSTIAPICEESGYELNTLQDCQCTNGFQTVAAICPSGSIRPSFANACYCILLDDPVCGKDYELTDDMCDCKSYKYSNPQCSNSDVCKFDSNGCNCAA